MQCQQFSLFMNKSSIPHHICQINPRIWILHQSICSWLPEIPSILLKETFKRAPTWPAVEENRHLVDGRSNRWLEDEEESIRFVVVVDWNQARIYLTEAEGNIGKRINNISYMLWLGLMREDRVAKNTAAYVVFRW